MATAAGFVPALGSKLVETADLSFSQPFSQTDREGLVSAATELSDVGMNLLVEGNSEGIILMGAAHRVAPDLPFPIQEIRNQARHLHARHSVSLQLADTQALTNAAYDLRFSGRLESAARLGATVPSIARSGRRPTSCVSRAATPSCTRWRPTCSPR